MASTCMREAISGTTPPYSACTSIWDAMALARSIRPFSTTAMAVSSQELSTARMMAAPLARSASAFSRILVS